MPGGSEWILILFTLGIIFLVPYIFFLLTLQNTLKAISYENRKMPPANVWLMLLLHKKFSRVAKSSEKFMKKRESVFRFWRRLDYKK